MSSFFANPLSGSPFSTPVGSRIEQATDGTLASENWALNMEICDMVNETEDGPKDAIKAIRKRLVQNAGKNYTVVMYTLIVLETCVKNCGKRFHILVCTKDFIQELVKMIGPKNDPPTAVQEKVLSLIQSWADAFRNQPDLAGVVLVYSDLRAKGIEFPPTDLDAMAPIHTPQRSVETSAPPPLMETQAPAIAPIHTPPLTNPVVLTSDPRAMLHSEMNVVQSNITALGEVLSELQKAKLQSELDVVQSNMAVLGEMLSEMRPGHEQPDELELLQELNATCHVMQDRLVELISKLSNTEMTAELLRINDDLNNLFLRYGRWEKNREAGGHSASAALAKAIGPKPALQAEDSLIDLGPPDDLTDQLSKLGVSETSAPAQLAKLGVVSARNGPQGDDEFDMFAQSRNVTYENSKMGGSTYKDNLEPDQVHVGLSAAASGRQNNPPDLEFDEMEAWLGESTGTEEAVTSSEFERFLAERAAAAEALPSTTVANANNTRQGTTAKDDKELFAL